MGSVSGARLPTPGSQQAMQWQSVAASPGDRMGMGRAFQNASSLPTAQGMPYGGTPQQNSAMSAANSGFHEAYQNAMANPQAGGAQPTGPAAPGAMNMSAAHPATQQQMAAKDAAFLQSRPVANAQSGAPMMTAQQVRQNTAAAGWQPGENAPRWYANQVNQGRNPFSQPPMQSQMGRPSPGGFKGSPARPPAGGFGMFG